jgi:hypothetical protein
MRTEGHPALEDVRSIDADACDAAERLAADGADYAQRAGLAAEPRVAGATDTIVASADELDAGFDRRRLPSGCGRNRGTSQALESCRVHRAKALFAPRRPVGVSNRTTGR